LCSSCYYNPLKNHYFKNKTALHLAVGAWGVLILLVWLLPVSFCGYLNDDLDTGFWYFLSESGGVYGTTVLAIVLCGAAASQQVGARQQVRAFAAGFGFLLLTLGGIAILNEYGIKPLMQLPRPSHQFLLGEGQADVLPQFYLKSVPERQAYLESHIQVNAEKYAAISPLVLSHWVAESGSSFPSGHSQNAFLLATMLVFWLCLQLPARKQGWCLLPMGWATLVCLSRVALGVHSELDVSLGAGFGLLLAYLLSLTGLLHRIFRITQP
jgi:membrane-associated phospholipid phosphatase